MSKPVVKYTPVEGARIEVGFSAVVIPHDHASYLVVNGEYAYTSRVIEVREGGEFETINSVYQLADPDKLASEEAEAAALAAATVKQAQEKTAETVATAE